MQLTANENLLPPRQRETLLCAALGYGIKLTARHMSITPQAVKGNRSALMHKLHAQNTPQMIAKAFERDMLRYLPIFVICFISAFGGMEEARPTRSKLRTATYSRVISRTEIAI